MACPLSPAEAVLAQLRKTRGPIRFSDLAEQERPGEDPKAFGSSVIEDMAMPASQENKSAQPAYGGESVPVQEPMSTPATLGPSMSEAGGKANKMVVKVESKVKKAAGRKSDAESNDYQTSRRRKSQSLSQHVRGRTSKGPWLWTC